MSKPKLSALERIENLERELSWVKMSQEAAMTATEKTITSVIESLQHLDRALGALHEVQTDEVKEAIKKTLKEMADREVSVKVEKEKKWIEDMLDAGVVTKVETVPVEGDDFWVTGFRRDPKTGEFSWRDWILSPFSNLLPPLQEALRGKAVGDVVTLTEDAFELKGVYVFVKETPAENSGEEEPTSP